MRMGRRGDRYYSSEQALNKLLSIQCAFLEQRDETLNGVLHTLLLLGRGHAATITADAQLNVDGTCVSRRVRQRVLQALSAFREWPLAARVSTSAFGAM